MLLSFPDYAVLVPPPVGRALTEAELSALMLAFDAVGCCYGIARALLGCLSPAVCEQLGSSTTYRLITAFSWAF